MPDPPMMPSTARVMTSPSQDFAEDVRLYCDAIIKDCRAVARGLEMPTTKDREKRQSIIDACRSMNALGINQGTSGNISLRHGEGLLITPTSTPYEAMAPEQIVFMDLDGSHDAAQRPAGVPAGAPWHDCGRRIAFESDVACRRSRNAGPAISRLPADRDAALVAEGRDRKRSRQDRRIRSCRQITIGLFRDEARFVHQLRVQLVILFEEFQHILAREEDRLQRLLLHVVLVFRRLRHLLEQVD